MTEIIPDGITFGTQVILIPDIASAFTHSGSAYGVFDRDPYRWVSRGDAIANFCIQGSKTDNPLFKIFSSQNHEASVRSPVSGLLIHPICNATALTRSLKEWNSTTNLPTAELAILLPHDEPSAESGQYIFRDVCRLIDQMRHYYLKKSRRWSMEAFTSEELNQYIELQLSVNPRIVPASPKYDDYFREARITKPELRPYLAHLP